MLVIRLKQILFNFALLYCLNCHVYASTYNEYTGVYNGAHSIVPPGVPTYEGIYGNPYAPMPLIEMNPPTSENDISNHRLRPKHITEVDVFVSLSNQQMQVYLNGVHTNTWSISSGKQGYETPTGSFQPQRMKRMHYSRKYDNAPMPYAVFFSGGYAIHAGGGLGRPRSHGCVRLGRSNAKKLYLWIQTAGRNNTDITIRP